MKVWKSAASFYTKLFVVMLQLRLQKSKNYRNSETSSERLTSISRKKSCKNFIRAERKHTIELFLKRNLKKKSQKEEIATQSTWQRSCESLRKFCFKTADQHFLLQKFFESEFSEQKIWGKIFESEFSEQKIWAKIFDFEFLEQKIRIKNFRRECSILRLFQILMFEKFRKFEI